MNKSSRALILCSLLIFSLFINVSVGSNIKRLNKNDTQLNNEYKNSWIEASVSPQIYPYSVGVVSIDRYIFLANSGFSGPDIFMRYNVDNSEWHIIPNPDGSSYWFKNSIAMTEDKDSYIYVLFGGSYNDCSNQEYHRYYFRRFKIPDGPWESLQNTPWYQGPGDALTWVQIKNNQYIYALLGTSSCSGAPWGYPGPTYPEGVQFWRYNVSNNIWDKKLTSIPYGADDGADLLWLGGDYIYAFSGAYNEGLPPEEERHFFRYNISMDNWIELNNTPFETYGGVDDGGSLVYPDFGEYIYAIKGGDDPGGGNPGDDFWCYNISSDEWTVMQSLPKGIGDQNGHRLGFIDRNIYCWRGCYGDGTLWSYNLSNNPPNKPTISGVTSGKAGDMYYYKVVTTDIENDEISYYIDWGDDINSNWTRLLQSGEEYNVSHIWEEQGQYIIRVKAKDEFDAESGWATLEVSMPKSNGFTNSFLLRLINSYPILKFIL